MPDTCRCPASDSLAGSPRPHPAWGRLPGALPTPGSPHQAVDAGPTPRKPQGSARPGDVPRAGRGRRQARDPTRWTPRSRTKRCSTSRGLPGEAPSRGPTAPPTIRWTVRPSPASIRAAANVTRASPGCPHQAGGVAAGKSRRRCDDQRSASPLARAGRPVHTPGAPTPAVPSARCDAAGHRPPCRRVRPSREDRDVTTAWLRITICWSRPARRSSKPESMTGTAPLLSRVRPRRKHADQRVPTRWLCRSYPYSQDHVAPVLTPRRRRKDWGERATRLPVRRLRKRDVPGVAPARGRYAVLA